MCRGGVLTSEDFVRCIQAFEVSGLKSCLDPTGGGVTLQGLDHEPGMKGRREMEERAAEVSGGVAQPQQGNLISCFRDSLGLCISLSLPGNGEELIPHFHLMCLISLCSVRYVEV